MASPFFSQVYHFQESAPQVQEVIKAWNQLTGVDFSIMNVKYNSNESAREYHEEFYKKHKEKIDQHVQMLIPKNMKSEDFLWAGEIQGSICNSHISMYIERASVEFRTESSAIGPKTNPYLRFSLKQILKNFGGKVKHLSKDTIPEWAQMPWDSPLIPKKIKFHAEIMKHRFQQFEKHFTLVESKNLSEKDVDAIEASYKKIIEEFEAQYE